MTAEKLIDASWSTIREQWLALVLSVAAIAFATVNRAGIPTDYVERREIEEMIAERSPYMRQEAGINARFDNLTQAIMSQRDSQEKLAASVTELRVQVARTNALLATAFRNDPKLSELIGTE